MTEPVIITDARGRKLEFRELGPDDMLNLIETGGASMTDHWMKFALSVASVAAIDGDPAPPLGCPKPIFLAFAKRLGNDGVVALQRHSFGMDDAGTVETAKN